jgi:ubiquinone/menaquinone biosynthesis C-methylase UbiE
MEIVDVAAFDFVYSRFLLTHLRDPERCLEFMVRAVRAGGAVVVEDIEFTRSFCRPNCVAFDRYVELYQAVVRHNGGDPAIGPWLVEMFLDAGLEDVNLDVLMPTFYPRSRQSQSPIRSHIASLWP